MKPTDKAIIPDFHEFGVDDVEEIIVMDSGFMKHMPNLFFVKDMNKRLIVMDIVDASRLYRTLKEKFEDANHSRDYRAI